MLFNSIDFAIFLPVVFVLYWLVGGENLKLQNLLIVCASYLFYGWWDWRFLFLFFLTTVITYAIGMLLEAESRVDKKMILWIGIAGNLIPLVFFKYFNFFIQSFNSAFLAFGKEINAGTLEIILPLGISFHTFQSIGYILDVYRKKVQPARSFIPYAAFTSFFPQLVAGPIERAGNLMPQFYSNRKFDYFHAVNGLRQILWGLFKKVVIADNCAEYVNAIFDHHTEYAGSTLVLGVVLFAFQIYCDFSGYSDIAIGTARLFGFNLMKNFAFPYFSRDIAEFWKRWHISLSTWFRDYIYIPLGGNRGGILKRARNVFAVFIISGFWHGANLTFIAWGFLNAIYFLFFLKADKNKMQPDLVAEGKLIPSFKEIVNMAITFILISFGWIFFRSESLSQAFDIISTIISPSLLKLPEKSAFAASSMHPIYFIILFIAFLLMEWIGRSNEYAIETIGLNWPKPLRYGFYYALVLCILFTGGMNMNFIYFQF